MPVLLVDAASLYFRAFFGVPLSVAAPDGQPVNAVRGFLDMSATLMTRRRPDRYVACLDLDWRPAFRTALVPSYKAHRVAPVGGELIPAELGPQVPILLDVLAALGLATAGAAGFEADDVIATLAARETEPVEVVSGDRDLMALVTDNVTLLYVGRGVAKLEAMGPAEVHKKYGVPAAHYPDFAALRGDPSDGLPGVGGIGDKTAAAIVSRFGAIESVLAAADAGTPGFPAGSVGRLLAAREYLVAAVAVVRGTTAAAIVSRFGAIESVLAAADAGTPGFPAGSVGRLLAAREYLVAAVAVVRGRTDVTLPALADDIPVAPVDAAALVDLSDRYGLDASINRLLTAMSR